MMPNELYPTSHRDAVLDMAAQPAAESSNARQPHPLAGLSLPDRKELRAILNECNKRESLHIASLCEAISVKPVRDAVLFNLCDREYLLWKPSQRGKLLEALLPFAEEAAVQAYAMLSLREPNYARSYAICAPAAKILHKTIGNPPEPITDELLSLAKRYGSTKKDAAAKIAFLLLKEAPITERGVTTAVHEARTWYADRQSRINPWLDLLIHHQAPQGISLVSDILNGSMRDPRSHPILFGAVTLPFLPHEIAFVSSLIALAAREVCKAFGQNNRMANSTAVILAASLIIGGRVLWYASRLDRFNNGRDRERVEALSHIAKLLASKPEEPTTAEHSFFKGIERQLRHAADGFLQSAPCRRAAKAAISGITEFRELWAIAQEHTVEPEEYGAA
jgi:hypothetical protein